MKCVIVVAKHEEDVSWLDQLPKDWETKVYDKSPSGEYDNVGREAETFARFILDHYDTLHTWDRVLFVQGHPFDHECSVDLIVRSVTDPRPVGLGPLFLSDGQGAPHHHGLKVGEAHVLLGLDPRIAEKNVWPFVAGAQYSVPTTTLMKRPREFWAALHAALYTGTICPWTMERLWLFVFGSLSGQNE